MEAMDCRNFKEMLDSYLSDELAVETNHAVLRHAEHCPACRGEMAARRNLRQALRGAVTTTTAPPDFRNRLRQRLRAEATAEATTATPPHRAWFFASWFRNLAMPQLAMATAVCAVVLVGVFYLTFHTRPVQAAELSQAILNQAAGDHNHCAAFWLGNRYHENDPVIGAEKYDPALQDLGKYSEHQAAGLTFHYAHVCGHYGRRYVHLIYTRGDDLVSLFVTERNAEAMRDGKVPNDDGLRADLQQAAGVQGKFTVSAYQTSKHVVLVVSKLSAQQNKELAEKLAKPISLHLRKIESK